MKLYLFIIISFSTFLCQANESFNNKKLTIFYEKIKVKSVSNEEKINSFFMRLISILDVSETDVLSEKGGVPKIVKT